MSKLTHAVLLAAFFQSCAAEAQCSARCGSEVGFTSSNGPDIFLSYDGARLKSTHMHTMKSAALCVGAPLRF